MGDGRDHVHCASADPGAAHNKTHDATLVNANRNRVGETPRFERPHIAFKLQTIINTALPPEIDCERNSLTATQKTTRRTRHRQPRPVGQTERSKLPTHAGQNPGSLADPTRRDALRPLRPLRPVRRVFCRPTTTHPRSDGPQYRQPKAPRSPLLAEDRGFATAQGAYETPRCEQTNQCTTMLIRHHKRLTHDNGEPLTKPPESGAGQQSSETPIAQSAPFTNFRNSHVPCARGMVPIQAAAWA